jgi:hypothetical protein
VNRGDKQSDYLGNVWQTEQHSKPCRVYGHAKQGVWRGLEQSDISHLHPLSLGGAVPLPDCDLWEGS